MKRDCAEWQGQLAMEAIGQAGEDESRELQEHLDDCPSCRQDAADLRSAAGALRYLDPMQIDRLERQPASLDLLTPFTGLAGIAGEWSDTDPGPTRGPFSGTPIGRHASRRNRRRQLGIGAAAMAVAAATVVVVAFGSNPAPSSRLVALTGEHGVRASVSLTARSWGTGATLQESGQAPGQVLTVSMKSSSGRWWVAGSYRTGTRSGSLVVPLSCAIQSNQITDVWVSDQSGHTVLNGYVG